MMLQTGIPAVKRGHNRQLNLLDSAARVFREKGYGPASMRDIAAGARMTVGSIYYHYPAKVDLLVAVYAEGVRRVSEAFDEALGKGDTPWQQLVLVAEAHLKMMLGKPVADPSTDADYASVFVKVQPYDFPAEQRDALLDLRNRYEARFRGLLQTMPLAKGVNRSLLRLHLIGALNHVPIWYQPDGRHSPRVIARTMVEQLRIANEAQL
jgi:TetR/AcrR family transcriptional regulator, cholesterol catabolism regulator